VVLSPDYTDFDGVSSSVMEIFREITPLVETVSLDEAFLDVSGATRRLGSPLSIAEHIRARVADEQRITCSVGAAATVSVAKLASRRAKPDGVLVVPPREVTRFLHPLDVGELWGVGEKTREQLHRLGLRTVGDLAHTPVTTLQRDSARLSAASSTTSRGGPTGGSSRHGEATTSPTGAWAPTRPSAATPTTGPW
jgi:DNA polymerase-4